MPDGAVLMRWFAAKVWWKCKWTALVHLASWRMGRSGCCFGRPVMPAYMGNAALWAGNAGMVIGVT